MEQRTTKDMNEIMKETIKNAKKTGPGARPRIRLLRVLHHRVPERHTRSRLRVLSLLGVLLLSAALTGCGAEEPELILVPCVAAAPHGVRLGHGAGYYDRFLAEHTGTTVCLCFRALLRGDLPAEGTDIITDLVISD